MWEISFVKKIVGIFIRNINVGKTTILLTLNHQDFIKRVPVCLNNPHNLKFGLRCHGRV